jgi:hypothetical protein
MNNFEKTFLGKFPIRFGHSIEVCSEVDCQPPNGWQSVAGFEYALHDERAQLAYDLPPSRNATIYIQTDFS